MHTRNRYMHIIVIVIAAAILSLAAACTKEYPVYYPEGGMRIVWSEPCEIEVPLIPSQEFADLPEHLSQMMENDPDFAYYSMFLDIMTRREARSARLAPEFKRIWDTFYAHEDKLSKYPYYSGAFVEALSTSDNVPTDRIVAGIYLDHLVDLRTIPPEDRIPGCIAGVPVHIIVGKYFVTVEEAGIQ